MSTEKPINADIVVVGGGPAGMAAALVAASHGYSVIIVAPSQSHLQTDARTTALMVPALDLLKSLEAWKDCATHAAPLKTLRIIDDTGRLVRAPTVDFQASEIEEEAFGYNIPNRVLNDALSARIAKTGLIEQLDAMASGIGYDTDAANLVLSDGTTITTKLVVGADGVNSVVRQSAGIDMRKWSYPQTACVMAFDHRRPHNNISTEFHTTYGPFTQVPLPGNRSSLVWVTEPSAADRLLELDDDALCKAVETQMQSMLGSISNPTKPQAWPLSSAIAHSFAAERMILLGQAAHAFPPIGAQGLNLGFRDVADFGNALKRAHGDPGIASVTNTYDRNRRADVYLRTGAVDALNRSLLSGFAPLQIGRAAGMGLLKNLRPLRSFLMREGIKPGSSISAIFKRRKDDRAA